MFSGPSKQPSFDPSLWCTPAITTTVALSQRQVRAYSAYMAASATAATVASLLDPYHTKRFTPCAGAAASIAHSYRVYRAGFWVAATTIPRQLDSLRKPRFCFLLAAACCLHFSTCCLCASTYTTRWCVDFIRAIFGTKAFHLRVFVRVYMCL